MKERTIIKLLTKFSISFLLLFSMLSCETESSNNEELLNQISNKELVERLKAIQPLVKDINRVDSYFSENPIDSTYFSRLFSNLGNGINSSNSERKLNILKVLSIDSVNLGDIINYTLEEAFTKKIIVSWNRESNNFFKDSVLSEITQDSARLIHIPFPVFNDSFGNVQLDFLFINKYGFIELDHENKNMNNYLRYKSSNYQNEATDEISFSPTKFKLLYGDHYTSRLTLGTAMNFHLTLSNIDFSGGEEKDVLQEAMDMVTKIIETNGSWDDLKRNSKYFKNSDFTEISGAARPTIVSVLLDIDDFSREYKLVDSLYRNSHVGILRKEYKPYSELYPNFDFED